MKVIFKRCKTEYFCNVQLPAMTNSYYQLGIAEGLAVGLSYSYISV